MVKRKQLTALVLITGIPLLLIAGYFKRDETSSFQRDNPVDSGASNYQEYETFDRDGDGEGDFSIQVNGGAASTENPAVTLGISGPRASRVYISEDKTFAGVTPTDWATSLTYTLSSTTFGLKTVYLQFEFYAGNRSKIYSNQISLLQAANETEWLNATFGVTINGGAAFTTNSNVTVALTAPSQATQIAFGESSNLTTFVIRNDFSYTFTSGLTNVNTKTIWVKYKNSLGLTKLVSTNIVYVPWRNFAIIIDGGAANATNTNCLLALTYYDSVQKIRLANDAGFNVNDTGWIAPVATLGWILTNGFGSKTVYLQVTNETYGLSYPVVSDGISAQTISATSVVINGNAASTTNTNVVLIISAVNAQKMMVSTNLAFANNSGWIDYSTNYPWSFIADGTTNIRMVYVKFSNTVWQVESAAVSDNILVSPINGLSVVIDGGAASTTNTNVTLSITAVNAQMMRVSTNSGFGDGSGWTTYATTYPWSFVADGTTNQRNVYVQFSNNVWQIASTAMSDTILPVAPTGISFSITGNATRSTNNIVLLTLVAQYADRMLVGTNLVFTGSSWQPFTNYLPWTLYGDGSGTMNWVYVQFSNSVWQVGSFITNDTIYYDTNFRLNSINQEYQRITGGTFAQGQTNEVLSIPVQTNTVSTFFMSIYKTRYIDWTNVTAWATNNGYDFDGRQYIGSQNTGSEYQPVSSIMWYDAVKWCNALSEKEGRTPAYYTNASRLSSQVYRNGEIVIETNMVIWKGNGYRLPTEAEWEFACRAGTTSTYFWGETEPNPATNYAWYYSNNNPIGSKVCGTKLPNPWGLYDMEGNLLEWCWDWYSGYTSGNKTDPLGWSSSSGRSVLRSCAFDSPP